MTHQELQSRASGASPRPVPAMPGPGSSPTAGIFNSLGDQLRAIALHISSQRTSAPTRDPRIDLLELRAAAGSSETIPSDGGLLVQPEFAQVLIEKIFNTSVLLNKCRHYPITIDTGTSLKLPAFAESSRADGQRFGGINSYWVGEAQTAPPSMPKFRLMELLLKKILAFSYATREMLADANLLGAALEDAVVNELKFKAEYAALFGDGVSTPLGILSPGNLSLIVVPAEGSQDAGTITANNVTAMYSRSWPAGRSRSIWLVNGDMEGQLSKLTIPVGTSGGSELPLFKFAESDGDANRLMGLPVVSLEYMPALGTQGDIALIDANEYLVMDKGGVSGVTSLHVLFNSDQQCFRWRWRLDGQPLWDSPVVPFNGGAVQSPFVTLAARP
jgi:HK97 family phage major capsid protein